MKDAEAIITLRTEMANDLLALERIAGRLDTPPAKLRALPARDPVTSAVAFDLHNYYSVSENLMRRVSTAFENALDPNEWHRQLLSRMSLGIPGIRPALLDPELRQKLDELRKFRHFFRNAYDRELDPAKVACVLEMCLEVHSALVQSVQHFLSWLEDLAKKLR